MHVEGELTPWCTGIQPLDDAGELAFGSGNIAHREFANRDFAVAQQARQMDIDHRLTVPSQGLNPRIEIDVECRDVAKIEDLIFAGPSRSRPIGIQIESVGLEPQADA